MDKGNQQENHNKKEQIYTIHCTTCNSTHYNAAYHNTIIIWAEPILNARHKANFLLIKELK